MNSTHRMAVENRLAAHRRDNQRAGTSVPVVGVWLHVIRAGKSLLEGDVPNSWLIAQINVLNMAFTGRFR